MCRSVCLCISLSLSRDQLTRWSLALSIAKVGVYATTINERVDTVVFLSRAGTETREIGGCKRTRVRRSQRCRRDDEQVETADDERARLLLQRQRRRRQRRQRSHDARYSRGRRDGLRLLRAGGARGREIECARTRRACVRVCRVRGAMALGPLGARLGRCYCLVTLLLLLLVSAACCWRGLAAFFSSDSFTVQRERERTPGRQLRGFCRRIANGGPSCHFALVVCIAERACVWVSAPVSNN